MNSFLRKQKLIDSLSLDLNCDKNTFTEKFKKHVKESDLKYNLFESYIDTTYIYKGNIINSIFKIQKIRSFVSNKHFAVAKGKVIEKNDSIRIEMEINGISSLMKFRIFFMSLFYLILFTVAIFTLISNGSFLFVLIYFILAILNYGILFFLIKSSVKNFKKDIEREFYFWIK